MPATTPALKVTATEELDAVLHWRTKHAQAIKERDALQLLLNQRDEQIETLKLQHPAVPVAAPLNYGSLDAAQRLALCRGDAPAAVPVIPELTAELRWIFGLMCFQCIHYAQGLRRLGRSIPEKAEHEQAAVIHWMLSHYMKDPVNWRLNAAAEMKSVAPEA
ncbi:hypothetical protein PFWH6_3956 [Pseudomonas fluorescens WH6]|nr:hypothetical protein PFWH6_3956 [Pseudomonas fluorescens WH6]